MTASLQITATAPDPAILDLPWHIPLEDWPAENLAALPRGISRHVVRFVKLSGRVIAVKEIGESVAYREYELLRALSRIGVPSVEPVGVITGRQDPNGERLEAVLVTEHLQFSLPYRALFSQSLQPDQQHGEGVDQPARGVRLQALAEQSAVGQGELQMLGDQYGLQPLAVRVLPAGDHPDRFHARHADPAQCPQQLVLAVGDALTDLLHGDDAPGQLDEPHHVPGDAAGQGGEVLGRPVLQRDVPGQVAGADADPDRVALAGDVARVDADDDLALTGTGADLLLGLAFQVQLADA